MIKFLTLNKVQVSRAGVACFNAQWPCSPLQSTRSYWFEFDDDSNLVDCDVPEHSDGEAAKAMGDDCAAFHRIGTIPDWAVL